MEWGAGQGAAAASKQQQQQHQQHLSAAGGGERVGECVSLRGKRHSLRVFARALVVQKADETVAAAQDDVVGGGH